MDEDKVCIASKILSRKELAKRWGCCTKTIKTIEDCGLLRPMIFPSGMIRYNINDVHLAEKKITLERFGALKCKHAAK
jgi:hypothetical protein